MLEPRVGGRIYERTADGTEIDCGVVTRFEPPACLGYRRHIGRESEDVTDVLLRFVAIGDDRCRVDLVHSGWDALGDVGAEFRTANFGGWDALIPNFVEACVT